MAVVRKEACAGTWFTLSVDRRALLAALEHSPQTDLVIDLCMSDLQTHGHRRLLTTDEGEKELILWSTAKIRPTHAHISQLFLHKHIILPVYVVFVCFVFVFFFSMEN